MLTPTRYWDWSLDAADLAESPIWDSVLGFGGDGDEAAPSAFQGAHCVTDGPFGQQQLRHWRSKSNGHGFDIDADPHCLNRGFERRLDKKLKLQSRIGPEAVDEMLAQETYGEFFDKLETYTHNAIPQFINGDFTLMTAPNGKSLSTQALILMRLSYRRRKD